MTSPHGAVGYARGRVDYEGNQGGNMSRIKRSMVFMVAVGAVALASAAPAAAQLSLTISNPRVEEAPITFTASGTARPADSRGESQDYLQGAIVPQAPSCPAGQDEFGNIPGAVLPTFADTPTGPFNDTYQFNPSDDDLVAGSYLDCVYLIDRASGSTLESAQMPFTVRKAYAQVRVLGVTRHMRFGYDILGQPWANISFLVRASVEVPGRELRIGIERPGQHRACTGDLNFADAGSTDTSHYALSAGAARNYRIRMGLWVPSGPFPYGRRVRVCAMVTVYDNYSNTYLVEALSQMTMLIRR